MRDQLKAAVKKLRVGNLMVLLHIGSMPHELTLKNIDMFAREVKPHFRDMWDDEWENHWWPERLKAKEARGCASGRRASHDGACGEVDSARRALAPPGRARRRTASSSVSPAPA